MSFLTTDPLPIAMLVAVAAYLMTTAGLAKKQLALRAERCRVCGRSRTHCRCRWQ